LFLFPFAPHACKDMWYKMLRHWDSRKVHMLLCISIGCNWSLIFVVTIFWW
jgi:hypothetical protein